MSERHMAVHPPTPENGGYGGFPRLGDNRCELPLEVYALPRDEEMAVRTFRGWADAIEAGRMKVGNLILEACLNETTRRDDKARTFEATGDLLLVVRVRKVKASDAD